MASFCRSIIPRLSAINFLEASSRFVRNTKNSTGRGPNTHRSNQAKLGLFHGKDVRFGKSISHSHARTNRKWSPNVFNKRVWSFALDDWVRFKMTARAMKEIDNIGGIDNYLLALNEDDIKESNYVLKMRNMIASTMFHRGLLSDKVIWRLGYHKSPPQLSNDSKSSTDLNTSAVNVNLEVGEAEAHLK